jgi:LAO/AO transport system kinase
VAVVVQPGSGDVLQFLKSGIMEIPDVLVVTKADLGRVATRAIADLRAALRSLGDTATQVVAVSSVAPPSGIEALAAALDTHCAQLDIAARRASSRRRHALADHIAEYGDRGLRALGGRRAAQRWLDTQAPGLDVAALRHGLQELAGAPA